MCVSEKKLMEAHRALVSSQKIFEIYVNTKEEEEKSELVNARELLQLLHQVLS